MLYVTKLHYKSINPCRGNKPTYFITPLLYQPGVLRNKDDTSRISLLLRECIYVFKKNDISVINQDVINTVYSFY